MLVSYIDYGGVLLYASHFEFSTTAFFDAGNMMKLPKKLVSTEPTKNDAFEVVPFLEKFTLMGNEKEVLCQSGYGVYADFFCKRSSCNSFVIHFLLRGHVVQFCAAGLSIIHFCRFTLLPRSYNARHLFELHFDYEGLEFTTSVTTDCSTACADF